MKKRERDYILMALPAILLLTIFVLIPLANTVRLSFFRWNGYSQNMKFLGLKNFTDLVSDKDFWRSFANTMVYGFGSTLLQNLGGLGAAVFLNQKFKGKNAVRVVLYMPIMISAFIMGQIVYYFVQYDGGVLNEILALFGLEPVYWMKTGWSSVIMITLTNSWQYMGLCMVIYLAGLQNIPTMYREAARLDGAGKWSEFRHVVMPLLIPSITTAVITNLINGFKMYDIIVSMSGGGPSRQSMSLSYYVQLLYFNDEKAGYASAVGFMIFVIIILITIPVNRYFQKREVEY